MALDLRAVSPVQCPACRHVNRAGAFFCAACGTALASGQQIVASLARERDQTESATAAKRRYVPRGRTACVDPTGRPLGLSNVGRVRANNEDSVLVSPVPGGGWMLIVADGMGGAEAGEIASSTAAVLVRELVENDLTIDPRPTSDHRSTLVRAITAANRELYGRTLAHPDLRGMGCTLTVALVQGCCVELAHVGDSRGYRLTADRRLEQLTLDHTMVAHMVRLGHLTPAEAEHHPLSNQLYRAVGTDPTLEVDTYLYALQPADRLVLCSDGLILHCRDAEIAKLLAAARSPEDAAHALIRRTLEYGAEDNVSVAVLMGI